MTRDDLPILRNANPVPTDTGYPESEITARIADITRSDGTSPVALGAAEPDRPSRRWLIPSLAAAAMVAVAIVAMLVANRGSGPDDAAGASPVSCQVSTAGGHGATRTRERAATQVIRHRVETLGGTAAAFVTDDGTVGFTPHGVPVAGAAQACRAASSAIRALVIPPVQPVTTAPRVPDPLRTLGFAVPDSEAAVARLTTAQRARLTQAMSRYDCSRKPAAGSTALLCDEAGGRSQVYLLAPAIVGSSDVASATAQAPSDGQVQWVVALSFHATAAARLEQFTGRHHTSSATATATAARCGSAGGTACADFLALVTDDVVASAPITDAQIGREVAVSGGFDQAAAQALADSYTAASIGLRPA